MTLEGRGVILAAGRVNLESERTALKDLWSNFSCRRRRQAFNITYRGAGHQVWPRMLKNGSVRRGTNKRVVNPHACLSYIPKTNYEDKLGILTTFR
jgi:hypothetical protein